MNKSTDTINIRYAQVAMIILLMIGIVMGAFITSATPPKAQPVISDEASQQVIDGLNYGLGMTIACSGIAPDDRKVTQYELTWCQAYVKSMWDVLTLDKKVCSPKGMVLNDAIKVIVAFSWERPETLAYISPAYVALALVDKWPCSAPDLKTPSQPHGREYSA
ncbi:MAG: hypothetical protein KUG81_01850 [Gammaproteobacteria bacterium]|nr:hypothetical protein [Gammaproteobacteria bacterium]